MTQPQFVTTVRTQPLFRKYSNAVGNGPAVQAMNDIYTECLRGVPVGGNWGFGNVVNPSDVILRFADETALGGFFTTLDMLVDGDIIKMGRRQTYIDGLKGEAGLGQLYTRLTNNTEPEGNYYAAPVPTPPRIGAPPIPPRPQWMIEHSKATSWLTHGVHGNTSAYTRNLRQLSRRDGSNPLGANDTIARQAWSDLVPIAPGYRGWSAAATAVPYPSNIGGGKVLNDVLADLSNNVALPPLGDNRWYDWALFVYGSMMTVQAFTDGNKRISRLAYALMIVNGGVPFVAPNGTFGAALGAMA